MLGLGLTLATLTHRIYLDRHAAFLSSKRFVTQSNGHKAKDDLGDDASFSEVGELIILYKLRELITAFLGAFNGGGRGMPCGPLDGYEPTDHGEPPSLNA